jgi:hypothetical protein
MPTTRAKLVGFSLDDWIPSDLRGRTPHSRGRRGDTADNKTVQPPQGIRGEKTAAVRDRAA